jgi:hypothetical protein
MFKIASVALLAAVLTATSVAPSAAQAAGRQPGQNQPVPPGSGSEYDCSAMMGHMRGVKQADIQAIRGNRVVLQPVCEDLTVRGKNEYGSLFNNGNVNHLRLPMGRNPTLMAALNARGYDQHDVVSLRFGGGNSIILYVHQRDMR